MGQNGLNLYEYCDKCKNLNVEYVKMRSSLHFKPTHPRNSRKKRTKKTSSFDLQEGSFSSPIARILDS